MTEAEFLALTEEIVMPQTAKALYRKLTPFFEKVDRLIDDARYAHARWIEGELTRLDGMDQVDKALRQLGH